MKEKKITRSEKLGQETAKEISSPKPFPIVGLGASAGGIEAFTTLLNHLDPTLGMAYVFILHLSPNHKSILPEILQSKTKMKVHSVEDGMEVKENNVYVIPPNTFMSLVDGHLKLDPRSLNSIGNFAVDYFLTALASVYKNNAIGVILSGTATDGTLGLKAIKAQGGITFAQDKSAKYIGMPKSAYDSGYADFILSPEGIARELALLGKLPYTISSFDRIEKDQLKQIEDHTEELKKILGVVKSRYGIDFFLNYKPASIYRRVVRRMALSKLDNLAAYYSILKNNDKEVEALYNDFLINVTNFFRDPDFFKTLAGQIFPDMIKERRTDDPIRVWVAGCATGEEAYSIAICIAEFLEDRSVTIPVNIFASDLDGVAIEKARLGIYPVSAIHNVSEHYVKRYFKKLDGHFQIERSIREMCIFSQQNLLKDPPFSRMDLISCQNVLIYLENGAQRKVLQAFHYALKPSGFLFLGRSETVGSEITLFNSLDKKIKVYTPKPVPSPPLEFIRHAHVQEPPKEPNRADTVNEIDIEKDIGNIILSRFVSPCVVVDQNMVITQFFGATAPYLAPVKGKASFNLLKMIREDLLIDLRSLLHKASKTGTPAIKEGITIYNKKTLQQLAIQVIPRKKTAGMYFLIVFQDNGAGTQQTKSRKATRITDDQTQTIIKLEDELLQSRELIKTTNEEYETTYEELQANNEEILSSNEELQSVNEELETSKEELQSANEELTTINEELQKRNLELKESHNYAEAIFQTMHNPLVVLTANLQVRIANRAFYQTFNLEQENTESRFIYDLGENSWDIPALRDSLNEVMTKKSSFKDFEFKHYFPGLGELTLLVHIYRLLRNDDPKETLILLAFNNISELLRSNKELRRVNDQLEQFAFISSHDLQEPLRKIETFSNFLLGPESEMNAYAKKYAGKIQYSASRMSALLKDLLSYSVLLNRDQKKFIEADLNDIIKKVVTDFELTIERTNAKITISKLPVIEADPIQMNQLFHNLISNALKYGKENPVVSIQSYHLTAKQIHDYAELKRDKSYVAIEVKDNGIGFHPKYANTIFTFFQRLNDKKNVEGTGMGLSICKKIAEDHGGIIFADGTENVGALFTVILPTHS